MSAHARGSLCTIAAELIGDDNRQWIQVMPVAENARNGDLYFTITREDLETLAASIRANAGKIPVDYDHAAYDGGSSRAAGWFTGEARVVDDADLEAVLEAEVEWTPRAAQEIRDGEYRFTSAEWGFAEKDAKSGLMTTATRVKASTLTNRPFFNELAALAAASGDGPVLWDAEQGINDLQADLAAALNPGATNWDDTRFYILDVDVVNQRALVSSYGPDDDTWIVPYQVDANGNVAVPPTVDWTAVEQAWVADSDQEPDDAPMAMLATRLRNTADHIAKQITTRGGQSAASTKEDQVSEELKALAADLGLAEDATDEQIHEAAKTAKASADRVTELEQELAAAKAAANGGGDRVVAVDKEQLEQLRRDAEQGVTARKAQLSAEADTLVTAAVADGRIAPASRDSWRTAILPDGATSLVQAETDALAALAKGRLPVVDAVVTGDAAVANQFDTVIAHFGLKPRATA